MKFTVEEVYVMFWKPHQKNGVCCQWYNSEMKDDQRTYSNAEQYMMFKKAELFGDVAMMKKILREKDPSKMRSLGRLIKNFDERKWEAAKYNIVVEGNYMKFTQNLQLKNLMLSCEDYIKFVEASPFDRIWGIGYNVDIACRNKEFWGQNLLGKALNDVRNRIKIENTV
jgi:ribA/ribD-fused uncharacterized protein